MDGAGENVELNGEMYLDEVEASIVIHSSTTFKL